MYTTVNLHETLKFAHEMHEGVEDWTGLPYIMHPIHVTNSLPVTCGVEDQQIGLLHDVPEDCKKRLYKVLFGGEPVDIETLFDGFFHLGYSPYVVKGLKLVTRDYWPGLTYKEYILNIAESNHFGAMNVKLQDNYHNNCEKRRLRLPLELQEKSRQMSRRYNQSIAILEHALGVDLTKT